MIGVVATPDDRHLMLGLATALWISLWITHRPISRPVDNFFHRAVDNLGDSLVGVPLLSCVSPVGFYPSWRA